MTTPPVPRATLGEILAAARRAREWSLREAERHTGVANAHLSQIETGAIRHPSGALLLALAAAYEVDPWPLLELSGNQDLGVVLQLRARVAELEALTDAMLAAFSEGSVYSDGAPATRSAWVPVHEVATWRAIRNAGERAVAAIDEPGALGDEIQGGGQ